MDKLITELQLIGELAAKNKTSWQDWLAVVKKIPVEEFDQLAHPVVNEVTHQIDCTQCGNCCRYQEPGVTNEEINRLAAARNIPVEDFKNKFIAWDREGVSFLCEHPCTFLEGNICSVYSIRPQSCADFPGLHRPRLKWRMKQVEENYAICPIVFNVVEKLKKQLGV
jgi:Fe-S-cluster containining protein